MLTQLIFTLRRIRRNKLTTTIHLLGLTLGILCCLVIFLYVNYEFSYDRFHPDRDKIFRIIVSTTGPGGVQSEGAGLPAPLAADLRRECTGFSAVAGIYTQDSKVIVPEGPNPAQIFKGIDGGLGRISFADPGYLEIFNYKWLAGSAATALNAPNSVVLTGAEAARYFGQGNPADWIGRSIIYFDSLTVSVSGIVEGWQQNSDFGFTDLISYATIEHSFLRRNLNGWNLFDSQINAFVKLSPGTTVEKVEKQFLAFFNRHETFLGETKGTLLLQPLADIHFNSNISDEYGRRAHKPTLYALAGIALFLLLMATINFVNLSTAQSVARAKEVGVRKVLGSSRAPLFFQFLSETGIIVVFAMTLALLMANPVISALHTFIPDGVRFQIQAPDTWLFIGMTILTTCLLAGWYPALALSSFRPLTSLRGQAGGGLPNGKSYLRKGLIVFQFTVSLVFIIGTIMVGRQIHYMINTDLGFKKDAIVIIAIPGDQSAKQKTVFANEISRIPGVGQVSLGTNSPGAYGHNGTRLEYTGTTKMAIDAGFDQIDTSYISLYGLTLIAGRNFFSSDTASRGIVPTPAGSTPSATAYRAFIINETAAKALGFSRPADAVGQQVSSALGGVPGPVLGVVKDFYSSSLRDKIEPFFFTSQDGAGRLVSVKLTSTHLSGSSVKEIIRRVEAVYKKMYPEEQFQFSFYDEFIAKLYEQEQQTAQLMNLAMAFAIFISCMGLFGLATFTAARRTREIGIRKVLGAGVPHLVSLLSREFILLVLLSALIASPLAGWWMHAWLQNFAYRATMPWWIYLFGAIVVIVIALITVGFRAIRAATANPVKSLRVE